MSLLKNVLLFGESLGQSLRHLQKFVHAVSDTLTLQGIATGRVPHPTSKTNAQ
jgi:hypothetical protein